MKYKLSFTGFCHREQNPTVKLCMRNLLNYVITTIWNQFFVIMKVKDLKIVKVQTGIN